LPDKLVAWETKACGKIAIVAAKNMASARTATWRSANDAGFQVAYIQVHVKRAGKYDDLCGGQLKANKVYSKEVANEMLKEKK